MNYLIKCPKLSIKCRDKKLEKEPDKASVEKDKDLKSQHLGIRK